MGCFEETHHNQSKKQQGYFLSVMPSVWKVSALSLSPENHIPILFATSKHVPSFEPLCVKVSLLEVISVSIWALPLLLYTIATLFTRPAKSFSFFWSYWQTKEAGPTYTIFPCDDFFVILRDGRVFHFLPKIILENGFWWFKYYWANPGLTKNCLDSVLWIVQRHALPMTDLETVT